MTITPTIRIGAGAALALGLVALGPMTPSYATAQHTSQFFFPVAGNNAPASCTALVTFPAAFASDDVNGVQHQTTNNNGGWGGETFTGPATLYVLNGNGSLGAPQYSGHITQWDGGGQNSPSGTNQTEGGITLDFHGTNTSGQTLHVHLDGHSTTNNAGTPTSSVMHLSCSS